jgi:hypothetical protein
LHASMNAVARLKEDPSIRWVGFRPWKATLRHRLLFIAGWAVTGNPTPPQSRLNPTYPSTRLFS